MTRYALKPRVIQCQRSQYSFDNGRSACTFIALAAACRFSAVPEWSSIRESDLDEVLELGVQWYEMCSPYLQCEHSSAAEAIPLLQACGEGVFPVENPGLISYDINVIAQEQRLLSRRNLSQLIQNACNSGVPAACVLTKPPETLLLLCTVDHNAKPLFLLFDSHPRRDLQLQGCSIIIFPKELDLVHAILERLPVTQIDGVDDYQLQQLNSFEMTTVSSLLKVQPTVEVAATQEIASVNSCRCEETAAKIAEMAERMQRIEEMFGHLIVKFNDLGDTAVPLSDEVSLVTENVSQLRLQNDQPVYPANLEEEKMVSRSSRVDSHSSESAEHTSWATNGTQHEDSNMVLYQNSSPRRKASRGSSAETQQDSQWFKGHDRGEGIDNGERAAEGLSYEDTVMMPAGGGDELHEVRKKLARQYRQSQRKADKLMK